MCHVNGTSNLLKGDNLETIIDKFCHFAAVRNWQEVLARMVASIKNGMTYSSQAAYRISLPDESAALA